MISKNRESIKNEPPAPKVAEGTHNFEIVDISELRDEPTNFGVKDLLLVYCAALDDGEGRGKILIHRISRAFTAGFEGGSKSHFYELACAVTGEILDDTEPFIIPSLIGEIFRAKVMHKKGRKGGLWANIVGVASAPAGAKKLDDGERQFAKDFIVTLEERRAEKKEKRPSEVGANLPTKKEVEALKSEDAAISTAGTEDVNPKDIPF